MPLSQQYRERFDGYFHERRSIAPRFSTASREMMLRPSSSKGGVMLHDGTFPGNGLTNRNHHEQEQEEHVIGYFGTAASPRGGGDRTSFERLDSFGSAGATRRRCSSPTCSRQHHHHQSNSNNNNNGHTPQQMNLSLGSLSSAGGGGGSRFQSFAAGGRKDSFAATNRSSVFSTTTNMLSASHSSVAPHNRSTVFGTSTRKDLWATPDPTTRAKTPPPSTTQRRSSISSTSRGGGGQEMTDAYTRLREEAAREQAERTRRYRMEGVHTPRPYTATAPGAPTALQVVGGRAVSPRAGGGVIARSGRIACVPNVAPWDKIARQVALGNPTTPGPGAYQPHYGLV